MRLPKIVDSTASLLFTRPAGRYRQGLGGVGAGIAWSAALVPAAWVTRWSRTAFVPLRFSEAEWPAVRAWLERAMLGGSFDFYPDASETSFFACYLVSPALTDRVEPAPRDFYGDSEITIEIRRTDGAALDLVYYE